jgi:hypothetical protein
MAIRARSVGELLDGAFRLYREDLGLYMFTAIVASVPMSLFTVLSLTASDTFGSTAAILVVLPFALLVTVALWTALVHQMSERLDGREPAFGPSVRRAVSLFLRVTWATILANVVLFGAMSVGIVLVTLVGFVGAFFLPPLVSVIVASVIGVAVMVLLGLRVLTGIVLFLPGIVVEGLTGFESLKRSFALAKGGYLRILSASVFAWILVLVPVLGAYFVTGTTRTLIDPEAASSGVVGVGQIVVQQLLVLISTGFTTPFLAACILLLYFDQRVRLEAYDLQAEAEALAG